jgi:hypothetical protein
MLRLKLLLGCLAICLLVPATARASLITFSDVYDPLDVFFSGQSGTSCTGTDGVVDTTSATTCESLTWTQKLPGYNSSTDSLTGGTLTLTAYNDSTDNNQAFDLLIDLLPFTRTITDGSTLLAPDKFAFTILSQLVDGGVDVTLTSSNGNHNFYFAQSLLEASGVRVTGGGPGGVFSPTLDTVAVATPEPATLLLVGFGLIGTSAVFRRSGRKRSRVRI